MTSMIAFFPLLRDALWHSAEELPTKLSEKQVSSLLEMADKQAVAGLVAEALIRNKVKMPEDSYYETIGVLGQLAAQNELVNKGLRDLVELLEGHGIDYVVVKGQAVASYYIQPSLRQAGDIDYYCGAKDFEHSLQVLKEKWGIDVGANGSLKHIHYDCHEVTYEGHFSLMSFYDKKKNNYWNQLLDKDKGACVAVDGTHVKTLSPTLHVLYVFLHLYDHLMELGIGLRQFCDWAVMLHACQKDIDHQALQRHLKELGIEKAYRACGSILIDYLGLPKQELGCEVTEHDRRYALKILSVVFYRGNMGHYNKRNGFRGWRHKVESAVIKVSHFVKFMPLAPGYSFCWLWHELYTKVIQMRQ